MLFNNATFLCFTSYCLVLALCFHFVAPMETLAEAESMKVKPSLHTDSVLTTSEEKEEESSIVEKRTASALLMRSDPQCECEGNGFVSWSEFDQTSGIFSYHYCKDGSRFAASIQNYTMGCLFIPYPTRNIALLANHDRCIGENLKFQDKLHGVSIGRDKSEQRNVFFEFCGKTSEPTCCDNMKGNWESRFARGYCMIYIMDCHYFQTNLSNKLVTLSKRQSRRYFSSNYGAENLLVIFLEILKKSNQQDQEINLVDIKEAQNDDTMMTAKSRSRRSSNGTKNSQMESNKPKKVLDEDVDVLDEEDATKYENRGRGDNIGDSKRKIHLPKTTSEPKTEPKHIKKKNAVYVRGRVSKKTDSASTSKTTTSLTTTTTTTTTTKSLPNKRTTIAKKDSPNSHVNDGRISKRNTLCVFLGIECAILDWF